MEPGRIATHRVDNDGTGPCAVFACDACGREQRGTADVRAVAGREIARGALGGLLRRVPVVGSAAADQVERDRWRMTLDGAELSAAWATVRGSFRECPACHRLTCVACFDDVSDRCRDDSPRAAEIAAAQGAQAAAAVRGIAEALGMAGAVAAGIAAAHGAAPACAACGAPRSAGAASCAGCGAARACGCGRPIDPGARFCAGCGRSAG